MLRRFQDWLDDLPIDDPVRRAQGVMFQLLVLALMGARLFLSLLDALAPTLVPNGLGGPLGVAVLVALLVILALLRRGWLRAAAAAAIVLTTAIVTHALATSGLLNNGIIAIGYVIPIAIAGLLLSRLSLILVAGLCIIIIAGLAVATAVPPAPPPIDEVLAFALITGVIAFLLDRYRAAWDQSLEAARTSTERLHLALDASAMGIWDWDLRSGRIVWGGHHEQIMGLPEGSFDGRYETFARSVYPDDLAEVRAAIEQSLRELTPYTYEYRVVWPDGSVHWVWGQGRVYTGRDGKPARMIGVIADVTARKAVNLQLEAAVAERSRREQEIRKLNAELEQRVAERTAELASKNRELEVFAYSVSHDLKAPLRGIDGYSRLLEEEFATKLDGEGPYYIAMIRSAAAAMGQLIDDLLAYSRVERRALRTGALQIDRLVRQVAAEFSDDLARSGIALSIELPPLTAIAEAEGLSQVLRNLIDNAIKFSRGVSRPAIVIGGESRDGTCVLWIRDNGIGFALEYHDRIFDLFQRLHRAEEFAGTGIGLAIVRKAVERMGGAVWAESAPGEGATFFVQLPCAPVENQQ